MNSNNPKGSAPAFFLIAVVMFAVIGVFLVEGAAYASDVGTPNGAAVAETIARVGTRAGIPACAACHGAVGEGNAAVGYPRLAGLPADYLAQQLNNFADGSRSNPMMNPIAKLLDSNNRTALAEFYASLPGTSTSIPVEAQQPSHGLGEQLALHGKPAQGIPACVACHGNSGSGVGGAFPALAGQSATYIRNQIVAWKKGTRPPGPLGLMQTIAMKLSDQDVDAVADYFAALPAAPKGDTP